MEDPRPDASADRSGIDDATALSPSPWRRSILVLGGASMLCLGAWMNADRLGFTTESDSHSPPDDVIAEQQETEEIALEAKSEPSIEAVGSTRHRGDEGTMGTPRPQKSGLYAMKGPADAGRNAGILGLIAEESSHFLASPHGATTAGKDDEDVWGGPADTEVGEAFGVALGGVGPIGTGRGGVVHPGRLEVHPDPPSDASLPLNRFIETHEDPKSTFSIDVDTASYSNVRRHLNGRTLPPPDAVRTEELINYFDYEYPEPLDGPFSVTTEVSEAPWNRAHRLVHIGIQGKHVSADETPPRNLVFLIDVSGSMTSYDKLPLVKAGLRALASQMRPQDRIALVVYAGAAGIVLEPTPGDEGHAIEEAIGRLSAGGSTNGSEGIHTAYRLARRSFIRGGINRVILATDGDFNVGVTGHRALMRLIAKKRASGVYLSVLGVGTDRFNDHLMEQLADKGNGNYAYLDGELEARKVLVEESGAMLHTIAKDVKIQVEFDPKQVRRHRLIGYENRVLAHRDFDDDTKDAGEIGAGHTVTALYEVVPEEASDDAPLLTLNLRYKHPDGNKSRRISVPVKDTGTTLDETTDDYRWAAAVAMFGQKLRGSTSQSETSFAQIGHLAADALGSDPHCYRHQFLEMLIAANLTVGESPSMNVPGCVPGQDRRERPKVELLEYDPGLSPGVVTVVDFHDEERPPPWREFVLEVLRLLPPLLALPMFVLAFRRRRR